MDTLQIAGIVLLVICAAGCFAIWRKAVACRAENNAKQQAHLKELQLRFGQLTDDHKLHISAQIEGLRAYIEELRQYRDQKDKQRDQRISDLEIVVRARNRIRP